MIELLNLFIKYGTKALDKILKSIEHNQPLNDHIKIPNHQNFFEEARQALSDSEIIQNKIEFKKISVKTFLNRLLGCKVKIQNLIFSYFESALEYEIKLAKKEGNFDEGFKNLDFTKKLVSTYNFETYELDDGRKVYWHSFSVTKGISWNSAIEIFENSLLLTINKNGFYYPKYGSYLSKPYLAIQCSTSNEKYWLYSPTNGKLSEKKSETDLLENYILNINYERVKTNWNYYYYNKSKYSNINVLTVSYNLLIYQGHFKND